MSDFPCCDQMTHHEPADGFIPFEVVLPTDPGLYVESGARASLTNIWVLYENGCWASSTDSEYGRAEDFAPFTKLEPVAVTAKKVLDAVTNRCTLHCDGCSKHFADIRAEFGVTDE